MEKVRTKSDNLVQMSDFSPQHSDRKTLFSVSLTFCANLSNSHKITKMVREIQNPSAYGTGVFYWVISSFSSLWAEGERKENVKVWPNS